VPYEEVYSFGFEDMQRRVPDSTLLKKLTGWQPTRGIENIILDIASHINK
jgi:UDP-glucose 4-epimerase